MLTQHEAQVGGSHVELTPLSATVWRVCDDRCDDGDTRKLIGYLQLIDDEVEMMWMRPRPGVCYRYRSIEEAVRAVALRHALVASDRR
ncbi:hypothetical protein [Agromyces albus]|uniref:hypothetical protein n=1 Tax=Agromyces albus TaxID=205332 RepID=UPI002788132B|nr:hypothetical protein [Agromyces albus]MDQ0576218.1 hypothetical protein [Agromyces albus]